MCVYVCLCVYIFLIIYLKKFLTHISD
jgi:hypothetical protein